MNLKDQKARHCTKMVTTYLKNSPKQVLMTTTIKFNPTLTNHFIDKKRAE
jgi:hypothetical protein